MLVLKIESADNGSTFNIRIDDAEISVMKLKLQINVLTSIQPEDQILLWGVSSYKKLDSHFNIDVSMLTGDERIFLFNRRVYSDEKFHPIDIKLTPYEIPVPNHINLKTSKYYNQKMLDSSPLFKALPAYEETFSMNLKKGESYYLFLELSLQSSRNALNEHYVQLDCAAAAFYNLNDHFNSIESELSITIEKCERQQLIHQKVLDNFENDLAELEKYALHPSLVQAFISNESLSSSSSRLSIDPNKVNSLLDCLHIEKEIDYAKQCQNSHFKVEESLSQLKSIFDRVMVAFKQFERITIKDITSDGTNGTDDSVLLDIIKGMEDNIRLQQDSSMERLREDYHFVKGKLSAIFSEDNPNADVKNEMVSLLGTLEARRSQQEMLLENMLRSCEQVMLNKGLMEQSKTSMNMKMVLNLRSLSKLQSEMQHGLKKRLKLLQKYVNGHNQYFQHLNNIKQFSANYEQLLVEIERRKSFNIFFDKLVTVESNRIATLRSEETKNRELFMTAGGANLPPVFFEMIPSLQSKPPYYAPSLTEAEWLPDINLKDTGLDIVPKEDKCKIFDAPLQDIDEINASSKCSHLEYQNNLLMSKVAELTKKVEMLESNIEVQVKADNTTFMDTSGCNVNSNAYVERLLRGYSIIESLLTNDWETDNDSNIVEEDELLKVFPIIANAIMKVRELKASVANISVTESDNSDLVSMNTSDRNMKISFRSFDIDDIALFIPANSSCECYLAFHKNCPNNYLSEESLSQIIALSSARKPDYVLGKVILIETKIASVVSNPYGLELGTTYHAITVERLML